MTVNLDQTRMYKFRENGNEGSEKSNGISQILRSHESTSFSLCLETISSLMEIFVLREKIILRFQQNHMRIVAKVVML